MSTSTRAAPCVPKGFAAFLPGPTSSQLACRRTHVAFRRTESGQTHPMAEKNENPEKTAEKSAGTSKTAAARRGESATRVSGTASKATRTAGDRAKHGAADTAAKTESTGRSAGAAVKAGASSAGEATKRVGQAATQAAETGRRTLVTVSGKAATTAVATWVAVRARKAVVAGVGAGLLTAATASYTAGRRSAMNRLGPVTRLTRGRL